MITVFGIITSVTVPSVCKRCGATLAVGDLAVLATPGSSLYCFKMYHKNPVPEKGAPNGKENRDQGANKPQSGPKDANRPHSKNAR